MNTFRSDDVASGLVVRDSGGILVKAFANFQFDASMEAGIISKEYLDALYELSKADWEASASIYIIAGQ